MSLLTKGVFIISAKRTPIGAMGGFLKDLTACDLGEIAARAALEEAKVKPELIDTIVYGNVIQSCRNAIYLTRHIGLRVGVPVATPALTVNRLCGSGFQSIINAAQELQLGEAQLAIAGGAENMSEVPFAVWNTRFGTKLGSELKFDDLLWVGLNDMYAKMPMAITAENLAEKYGITREQCEKYAIQSQARFAAANKAGVFKAETVNVTIKTRKGDVVYTTDEHPRETTMEKLAKLPPVFKKGGVVTAGTASGICDGAGAMVMATEEAVKLHKLTPIARLVGYSTTGCDPKIMGIGPVPAINKLLKATNKKIADIDLVEVNEAFAPQYLACERELGLDPAKTNLNGGGIAIGHPLAATGSRISAHLVHEMRRRNVNLSVASACIGGGQGIALMLERV